MGRLSLVGLLFLGILVVAYAFVRSDREPPALSAEAGAAAAPPAETAPPGADRGGRASAAPPVAIVEKAPVITRSGALELAEAALKEASKAGSQKSALEKRDEARRHLSKALLEADAAEEEKLRKRVEELNEQVLLSDLALPGKSVLYTFQPGDRLWTLCFRVFPKEHEIRVEPGFLLWLNGISDARHIQEGQVVKVPLEALTLRVVKSRMKLHVLLGGVWIREFRVGIGANDRTPEGEFEIETKKEKPDWYHQGKRIPFGHPENPLGTRWMGFKRTAKAAGYGIHGTDDPLTVGKAVSQGCIRMLNHEVEELFEWVPRGTRVKIIR